MPRRFAPKWLFSVLPALFIGAQATAQSSTAGLYRAEAGPDIASMIELAPDGRFRFQHSEGALDEEASGRWTQGDGVVTLDTLPRPRAPEWQINEIADIKDTALSVRVRVPGGDSLAGIFIRIGFANGDRQAASTQFEGWSMDPDDPREPVWIEFGEPVHGISSPRFDLPRRRGLALSVTLVPNEIGITNFDATPLTMTRDGMILHWRGRDIPYKRVGRGRAQR